MIPLIRPVLPVALGLLGVAIACGLLQWVFGPRQAGRPWLRAGWGTDLTYAVVTPLLVKSVRRAVVAVALLPLAWAAGGDGLTGLLAGHGPLARQPLWLQGAEMLVLGDFIGYWEHRLFHRPTLWPIHAVHHSSPQLDWLAAFRVHPLNDIASGLFRAVPLVALGFAPTVLAGVLPLLTLHAIFLHADVDWSFGRFGYVVSSPAFHRWHHTAEGEGRERNFAGLLPVWDIVFGTFWMPGRRCMAVGIDDPIPLGWLAQLVWPLRRHGG